MQQRPTRPGATSSARLAEPLPITPIGRLGIVLGGSRPRMDLASIVLAPVRVAMRIAQALDDLATLAERAAATRIRSRSSATASLC